MLVDHKFFQGLAEIAGIDRHRQGGKIAKRFAGQGGQPGAL